MPRALRIDADKSVYHVSASSAPGRALFDELEEARLFVKLLRELAFRDGWTVIAWVLMPSSYHLAVRTGTLPLSRTMHALQGRFAMAFNRRHTSYGSVWNGRYQARWVDEAKWLKELVLYIHAQPVTNGLVDDPVIHLSSGHGELMGRDKDHLIDLSTALGCFASDLDEGREVYAAALRRVVHERWCQGVHRMLPWWREELPPEVGGQERGRAVVTVAGLISGACRVLGVERDEVTSRRRAGDAVQCREVIATVGVEAFGLRTRDIAEGMGKNADWISCVCTRGSRRRKADAEFRELCEKVELAMTGSEATEAVEPVDPVPAPIEENQDPAPEPVAGRPGDWAVWD